MKTERIQKFLANAGVGSRRQIEDWIRQGRLQVDGRPATPGQPVQGGEHFSLDGRPLRLQLPTATRVLALNKPEGVLCTRSDPQGRPTVFELLPQTRRVRWILVGRLDINTAGLLLVTNNGELANRLMHPSTGIEREYSVRVLGEATPEILARLQNGVELDDGPAAFTSLQVGGGSGRNRWYQAVLNEGRNREVRRLWDAVGLTVSRLIRVCYGPVRLMRTPRGKWRELSPAEVARLEEMAGLSPDTTADRSGESPARGRRRPAPRGGEGARRPQHKADKGRVIEGRSSRSRPVKRKSVKRGPTRRQRGP